MDVHFLELDLGGCSPCSGWLLLSGGSLVGLVVVLWYYLGQFLILGVFRRDVSRFRSISGCWWAKGYLLPAFLAEFRCLCCFDLTCSAYVQVRPILLVVLDRLMVRF